MLISASRRTDIPAFYGAWFAERVREGSCVVSNPRNPGQQSRLSLDPREVEAVVFWSKNPAPFFPVLDKLEEVGHRFYFHFTLNDYPPWLEPGLPDLETRLATFLRLGDRLGPERVVWRYDPVILSTLTPESYHLRSFAQLLSALRGATCRVVMSPLALYRKTLRQLRPLAAMGFQLEDRPTLPLLAELAALAHRAGLAAHSCATPGITGAHLSPGHCVDADLVRRLWGVAADRRKDPHQRPDCGCAVSKDLGAEDTCLHGCLYCYATSSPARAARRHALHRSSQPALIS